MRALIPALLLPVIFPAAPPEGPPPPGQPPPISDPWPGFRGGPDLAGRRAGPISDSPELVWTFDAKCAIESTAAISGGRVYVGTAEEGLICLELEAGGKTGKEAWRVKVGSGIRSSPAVHSGKVLFGDDAGIFHALETGTGKEAWKFDTRSEDGGGAELISSPTVHDGSVLFGSYDAFLYCVSLADGTLRWKHQTEGNVHSSPAVAGGKTFVAGCDEHLRMIDVATGKEVAALPMGAYSAASPAILGEKLVVGTFGPQVLCVDWKASKVLWTHDPEKQFPFYSSPAVGSVQLAGEKKPVDVTVLGGRDKMIHALRLDDGKPLWTVPSRAKIDASPVIIEGRGDGGAGASRVIVAGFDGSLRMLDLATGKEVWVFTAGPAFIASPAVGEGRLVISGEDGLVHCFRLGPPR